MKFRPRHLQHIAAAKAGFSERMARRMETTRHLAPQPNGQSDTSGPPPATIKQPAPFPVARLPK
jgi:hypothetical protein